MKIEDIYIQTDHPFLSDKGSLELIFDPTRSSSSYLIVSQTKDKFISSIILKENQVIELIQKLEMLLK